MIKLDQISLSYLPGFLRYNILLSKMRLQTRNSEAGIYRLRRYYRTDQSDQSDRTDEKPDRQPALLSAAAMTLPKGEGENNFQL